MTTITTTCDDSILGSGEYSASLVLTLTESGDANLAATERHSSQRGAMTFDVHHRRTLEWAVTLSQGAAVVADCEAIRSLADSLEPLVARVHAGHETFWDGSNYRGRLSDDAKEASDEIEALIETASWTQEDVAVWDAAEWLGSDHDVTADTTTEQIDAAAADYEAMAVRDDVRLTYSAFWGDYTGRVEISDMADLLRAITAEAQAKRAAELDDEDAA